MCGRYDQNQIARLIRDFEWAGELLNRSSATDSFNVAPGTYRPILHAQDDLLLVDDLHWGYRSAWAEKSGRVPMSINTRLEKVTGSYWRTLLKNGRAVVPAQGWYEWTGEKGEKQPWHIHRADRAPQYMAALANFAPETEHKASNGFTIITADAEGGMVDVHDRRPVVLTAADAALWLNPEMDFMAAEELLRSLALGADKFDWYKVDRAVGNVRSQGPRLAQPLESGTAQSR